MCSLFSKNGVWELLAPQILNSTGAIRQLEVSRYATPDQYSPSLRLAHVVDEPP